MIVSPSRAPSGDTIMLATPQRCCICLSACFQIKLNKMSFVVSYHSSCACGVLECSLWCLCNWKTLWNCSWREEKIFPVLRFYVFVIWPKLWQRRKNPFLHSFLHTKCKWINTHENLREVLARLEPTMTNMPSYLNCDCLADANISFALKLDLACAMIDPKLSYSLLRLELALLWIAFRML